MKLYIGLMTLIFLSACNKINDISPESPQQTFTFNWSKAYGGGDGDNGLSITTTNDNGMLLVGNTYSS
ncbi:MAG: hypothetical protein QM734_09775, partial [Cyclobacteriaceae bacterium]